MKIDDLLLKYAFYENNYDNFLTENFMRNVFYNNNFFKKIHIFKDTPEKSRTDKKVTILHIPKKNLSNDFIPKILILDLPSSFWEPPIVGISYWKNRVHAVINFVRYFTKNLHTLFLCMLASRLSRAATLVISIL